MKITPHSATCAHPRAAKVCPPPSIRDFHSKRLGSTEYPYPLSSLSSPLLTHTRARARSPLSETFTKKHPTIPDRLKESPWKETDGVSTVCCTVCCACVLPLCAVRSVLCERVLIIQVFPLSFFPQVIREYMFDNEGLWEQTARVQIWQQVCVSVSVCVSVCLCECLSLCLCASPSVCLSDLCLRLIVSVSPPCAAARCARSTHSPLFYSLRLESDPWLLRARWRAPQYASYHPHDPVSEKREIREEERHTYCALCALCAVRCVLCCM